MTILDVDTILKTTRALQARQGIPRGTLVYCSDPNGADLYGEYIAASPSAVRIKVLGLIFSVTGQPVGQPYKYDGQEFLFQPVSLIMADRETLRQVYLNDDARKHGQRIPFPNAQVGNWPEG